ncbi:Sphingoid long chain base kinase 5 [Fusarium oxysporum f. sp. albedinis]|nr:Sphingoid long chain base kinase 5 [Fusarium oxysporum f. sp. albedinis]
MKRTEMKLGGSQFSIPVLVYQVPKSSSLSPVGGFLLSQLVCLSEFYLPLEPLHPLSITHSALLRTPVLSVFWDLLSLGAQAKGHFTTAAFLAGLGCSQSLLAEVPNSESQASRLSSTLDAPKIRSNSALEEAVGQAVTKTKKLIVIAPCSSSFCGRNITLSDPPSPIARRSLSLSLPYPNLLPQQLQPSSYRLTALSALLQIRPLPLV